MTPTIFSLVAVNWVQIMISATYSHSFDLCEMTKNSFVHFKAFLKKKTNYFVMLSMLKCIRCTCSDLTVNCHTVILNVTVKSTKLAQ